MPSWRRSPAWRSATARVSARSTCSLAMTTPSPRAARSRQPCFPSRSSPMMAAAWKRPSSALSTAGLKLATAESCTGGLIANRLTDVPGSSAVFTHGFVTYANEAKRDLLGVPQELLDEHGAVSEPVARAMAEGPCA